LKVQTFCVPQQRPPPQPRNLPPPVGSAKARTDRFRNRVTVHGYGGLQVDVGYEMPVPSTTTVPLPLTWTTKSSTAVTGSDELFELPPEDEGSGSNVAPAT